MAKAAKGSPKSAAKSAQEEGPEPVKVNLYDGGALKSSLDDFAREVVLRAGYEEDVTASNIRIVFGLLAIAIALYAQLGLGKLPGTWWNLFACVAAYVIISSALTIYSHLYEGSAFLITKPSKGVPVVKVSSGLDRLEATYVLNLESSSSDGSKIEKEFKGNIAGYFHSDGYLAEEATRKDFNSWLEQFKAAVGDSKKAK